MAVKGSSMSVIWTPRRRPPFNLPDDLSPGGLDEKTCEDTAQFSPKYVADPVAHVGERKTTDKSQRNNAELSPVLKRMLSKEAQTHTSAPECPKIKVKTLLTLEWFVKDLCFVLILNAQNAIGPIQLILQSFKYCNRHTCWVYS